MKKLVLGALLAAVAASTGCPAAAPTDAVITASWHFTHFADGTARSCPTSFPTASIYSQVWDPVRHSLTGTTVRDAFNCGPTMHGTTDPLDGIFLVWVQIENDSGSQVYAKSESLYVDTADGDVSFDFPILDDAGFFFLTWDLQKASTGAPLSCAQAGVTGSAGAIETLATIVGTSFLLTDKFTCEHHYGTTDPLLAGTYTVSVEATVNDQHVGTAPSLTNKTIRSPNGLTDLGNIVIPID
jgi:hypothetical protein